MHKPSLKPSLIVTFWCGVMIVLAAAIGATQAAPANPAANNSAQARVIVKYRADSPLMRAHALSVSAQQVQRAQALGVRLNMALSVGAAVGEREEVIRAQGMTSEALAARLGQEADIEYAVPDGRMQHTVSPNDSLYVTGPPVGVSSGGPASGQWYLRAPTSDVQSGIDIEGAWSVSFGASEIVVAVLDTGVIFDHPDLKPVSQGGNLLQGFDMISDVTTANDGNGRDADASDPGDWVSQSEVATICNNKCAPSDSSWHGTQTSGLIAAATDNQTGIAGVGRHIRLLPVRVLGKGGGFDSDIIAGMRWAAGITVPGVAPNSTPARVLNLSLGIDNTACSAAYVSAINEITALDVIVVVAAGNGTGHAVSAPANCPGVLGIAGLRHVGSKVGFSDLGPEIALSAPGGNCVNTASNLPCLFPILTLVNTGKTAPIPASAGGDIYTDAFDPSLGTSFSAPLVAGTTALLLSAKPSLTVAQVRSVLQQTARQFPTMGATDPTQAVVPQCAAPQPVGTAQIDQIQCYCTTTTCGAGMLDAGAAMRAVSGLQAQISAAPTTLTANRPITFSSTATVLPAGHTVATFAWRVVDSGGIVSAFTSATTVAMPTATPTGTGQFTAGVTLTDNTGLRSSTDATFEVKAGSPPPVITLTGAASINVTQGATFTDPGATAKDSNNVDITNNIAVTGSVNATVVGSYTLTYNVTDGAGAAATPVSRTVQVVAPPPPPPVASAKSGGGGGGCSVGGGSNDPTLIVLTVLALAYLRRRHFRLGLSRTNCRAIDE